MLRDSANWLFQSSAFRIAATTVLALILALVVEIAVFNFQTFQSLMFGDVRLSPDSSLSLTGDNKCEITSKGSYYFEIKEGKLEGLAVRSNGDAKVELKLLLVDEGHSQPYEIVKQNIGNYKYLRLHTYGSASWINVEVFSREENIDLELDFNAVKPLDISKKRLCVAFFLSAFIIALRPSSFLHLHSYRRRYFRVALAICLVGGISLACFAGYNPSVPAEKQHQHQYYDLARALSEGQLCLDDEVSESLKSLENPYDPSSRDEEGLVRHQDYLWDHAYYNGKYYVYFGVLPALLFHLPYYLITGGEFPNWIAVLISLSFFAVGLVFLFSNICERWFKGCSQALFLLSVFIAMLGSWVVYLCGYPDLYAVPISLGLALQVWGLAFWVKSTRCPNKISVPFAMLGSACIALTLACRPQMTISGLIGLVLVGRYLKKGRNFIRPIAIALIPFVFVAVAVGIYNFARFGSPFDLGANYNLTTNDMTHRGFELDRLSLAFFAYLVQPPNVDLASPYIHSVSLASSYSGQLIVEKTMCGGALALAPVLLVLLSLLFRCARERIRACVGVYSLVVTFVLMSLVVVAFDANGAGILMRYFADFGIYLGLASALCVMCFCKIGGGRCDERDFGLLRRSMSGALAYCVAGGILVALVLFSLFLQMLWLFW